MVTLKAVFQSAILTVINLSILYNPHGFTSANIPHSKWKIYKCQHSTFQMENYVFRIGMLPIQQREPML